VSSFPEEVERLRVAAQEAMAEAAGDLSMCAIAKSGRPMPALKYHEGRAAMLGSIERALGAGAVDDERLRGIEERWQRYERLAASSSDWEAYLQGGLDVLAELNFEA